MKKIEDLKFKEVFLSVLHTYTKEDVYLDTDLASLKLDNKDWIEIVVFVNEILEIDLFDKVNVSDLDLSKFNSVGQLILFFKDNI